MSGSFSKPIEVSVELTNQCNLECSFCFNKISQPTKKPLSTEQLKDVVSAVAGFGVGKIRFTGGEPFLRPDLPDILGFAKQSGLYVMLNTNATLATPQKLGRVLGSVDEVLVSFHDFSQPPAAKTEAVNAFIDAGIFLRAASIMLEQNIRDLEKGHSLLQGIGVREWALLRPIPTPIEKNPVQAAEIKTLVEGLAELNKSNNTGFKIENAIPFCCHTPKLVSRVAVGGINDDGRTRLAVDCSGQIRPSYFLETVLGDGLNGDFEKAWHDPFMEGIRGLQFIAPECGKCRYLAVCMSGSRFSAAFVNHGLHSLDPLARPLEYGENLYF